MTLKEAIRARERLLKSLPVTGEILRGSLLERTVFRHKANCEKCASGEGHALSVLTVTYPGSRTRQISLRPEQVPEVRRWLDNYKKSQSLQQEHRAQGRAEQALVPQRPEIAHRMRGAHQVVKRRHGLSRCRYKGESGMKRWVGLGAIADKLINIGNAMARQVEP